MVKGSVPMRARRTGLQRLHSAVAVVVERLESRTLLSGALTPGQVRDIYGLSSLPDFGSVPADGEGQTVAIVDAYNDPDIFQDANTFSSNYSLPQFTTVAGDGPTLTIENQSGSTSKSSLPANAPDEMDPADAEESLDVEWAHAVAPMADIILFEANSGSQSDLLAAVAQARITPGVSVVSMSFGFTETSSNETSYGGDFTTPASDSQGITFIASTGDKASSSNEFPAFSPNVLGVGGTVLTYSGDTYDSESGWEYSGGGVSKFDSRPTYQVVGTQGGDTTHRDSPDVSWLAAYRPRQERRPSTSLILSSRSWRGARAAIRALLLRCGPD